jgi:hypothetical protein
MEKKFFLLFSSKIFGTSADQFADGEHLYWCFAPGILLGPVAVGTRFDYITEKPCFVK